LLFVVLRSYYKLLSKAGKDLHVGLMVSKKMKAKAIQEVTFQKVNGEEQWLYCVVRAVRDFLRSCSFLGNLNTRPLCTT